MRRFTGVLECLGTRIKVGDYTYRYEFLRFHDGSEVVTVLCFARKRKDDEEESPWCIPSDEHELSEWSQELRQAIKSQGYGLPGEKWRMPETHAEMVEVLNWGGNGGVG